MIVLSVPEQGMTRTEAAERFGVYRRWIHTLITRYQAGGLEALEAHSRGPCSSTLSTPEPVHSRVIELRQQLTADS